MTTTLDEDIARRIRLGRADWPWCLACGEQPAVVNAPADMVEVFAGPLGLRPRVCCAGCWLDYNGGAAPLAVELAFIGRLL